MPKIDLAAVPERKGAGYPKPFDAPCASRTRRRLGDAGGLQDFGVNLMTLPPGGWSSQRHWHSDEDEFVYVLEGELVLVEDEGETILRAGDFAAWPKGVRNGHHLINRSEADCAFICFSAGNDAAGGGYSDIDMIFTADGYLHKDGTPYGARRIP